MKNLSRLDWGQQSRSQDVKTPWGIVRVWGNTRVPKLSASKKVWQKWFDRFIASRERDEITEATFSKYSAGSSK